MSKGLVLGVLLFFSLAAFGQQEDSTAAVFRTTGEPLAEVQTGEHNPTKAVILSAVLPGAGQIYNKRWWKAALFWAGLGASIYAIHFNETEMMKYRGAYIDRQNGIADDYPFYTDDQLEVLNSFYRRNRDLSILITTGVYFLNILDAYVDAKLVDFEVGDDLSLRVEPAILSHPAYQAPAYGVSLKLTFP